MSSLARPLRIAPEDEPLLALLSFLERRGYSFVTPLNGTLRTVRGRPGKQRARDLRDVLGWSLPFHPGAIDDEAERLLREAGRLRETDAGWQATVRVSTVRSGLFLHSAYPPAERDAVFLGPDTYRFAEFLRVELEPAGLAGAKVLDVGAGAGVGGLVAADLTRARQVTLADINPAALRLAAVNAAHRHAPATLADTSGLDGLAADYDVIVANPPFIADDAKTYSAGGGALGTALSRAWAVAAMDHLAPRGRLLMYTGSPVVEGQDALASDLAKAAGGRGFPMGYRELDPDIFGGELRRAAYAEVERIAAVGVVISRPD